MDEKIQATKKYVNAIVLIVFIAIVVLFVFSALQIRFIQDDVYTSFRYVKNFLNGKGLVFNEGARVEGYTNFLWVILLSGISTLTNNSFLNLPLESIAQFLSIGFSVLVLFLTFLLSRKILLGDEGESIPLLKYCRNRAMTLLPVFMFAFTTPLVYWGVSAMETSLFVSLILLSIFFYLNNKPAQINKNFIIASVLCSLTRPEGIIFFGMISIHKTFVNFISLERESHKEKFRLVFDKYYFKEILFFAAPVFAYLIFRLIYYGYPFPNTYYAKTEFTFKFLVRGWKYFYDFARAYLLFGIFLFLPLILLKNKKMIKEFSLLCGLTLSWILVVIFIGGDVLPIQRFFLPIIPLIYILVVKAVCYLIDFFFAAKIKLEMIFISLTFTAFLSFSILNYTNEKREMMIKRSYESGLVKKMKIYSKWVEKQNEKRKSKIVVAMSTIGAFSYFTDVKVIDLVGLTDEFTAHNPKEVNGINDELPVHWKERHYNAEYVLSQKPDYIIFPAGAKPSAFAECAIFVQSDFVRNYYMQIFYSEELNQLLPIFTRKENVKNVTDQSNCSNKFIKHFIEANNYFLKLTETHDKNLLDKVMAECDSTLAFCDGKLSEVETLKGMAYYHIGNFINAENYLTDAVQNDSTNCIARYYLKNIFFKRGDIRQTIKTISEIQKYSPDALPNLSFEN